MKPDTHVVGPIKDERTDVVPLPTLPSEQVRQFIRASKAENTLRATVPTGETSAGGPKRTAYPHCRRLLSW